MRLLWLSHVLPHPPKGGVLQRSFHLISGAASDHDVDLLTFRQKAFHPTAESVTESVRSLSEWITVRGVLDLPVDRSPTHRKTQLLASTLTPSPYTVRWNHARAMERAVAELSKEVQYDAVHFDTIGMFQYRHHFPDSALILNHHNVESHMMARRAEIARGATRPYLAWEARRLRAWERRHGGDAHEHLVVSNLDAQRLKAVLPEASCRVVENAVDTETFRPLGTTRQPGRVVFVGRIDGYANLSAVRWMRDQIWPRILANGNTRSLGIIGRNPPRDIREWGDRDPSVEVSGCVDDVRLALDAAEVFVCPIFEGGGTRLKILDAMAMGLPIVSHPMAIEGLELTPGEHVLVAEDTEGLAGAVDALLKDEAWRSRLGKAARQQAEALYSTRAVHAHLREAYASALERAENSGSAADPRSNLSLQALRR